MKPSILIFSLLLFLGSCSPESISYHKYEGPIFGTSFHITYAYRERSSLDDQILKLMQDFNRSLSTYDPKSVISRINTNDPQVRADAYFTRCFEAAVKVSVATDGAFDLTVAPLVNVWGFGFTKRDSVYPQLIDSLLKFTGYQKVRLEDSRLIKQYPQTMLDASAIAKGLGVDVVAEFLEEKGVTDYLVEIGGELRCRGKNPKGELWRVGVDKPIENMLDHELEAILRLSNTSMATSGNYRQFYEKDGVKYSHTIDPKSGYPVRHSLLSATVLAPDCMTADAYATAFMVMGLEKTKELVLADSQLEAFLIYSNDAGEWLTWVSPGMEDKL